MGDRPSRVEVVGRALARRPRRLAFSLAAALVLIAFGVWALLPVPVPAPANIGTANSSGLAPPAALKPGLVPPAFSVAGLRPGQGPVALAALRGRPVVVNFFASWCHPCRAEMPLLEQAYRRWGSTVSFVGIDVSDSSASALAFAALAGVTYPLGADPSGAVAVRYQLLGLPDTVFVASNGRIAATQVGQLHTATLTADMLRLTGKA